MGLKIRAHVVDYNNHLMFVMGCLFLFLVDYYLEVDVQNKLLQNYSAL